MTKISSLILVLGCGVALTSCSASNNSMAVNYEMACDEIMTEIDKTRQAIYAEKTTQKGTGSEVAGTAADVAATGAGMAGVPYVGGIYSICKTLVNHTKRTTTSKASLHQARLDELEYLAQRKECTF